MRKQINFSLNEEEAAQYEKARGDQPDYTYAKGALMERVRLDTKGNFIDRNAWEPKIIQWMRPDRAEMSIPVIEGMYEVTTSLVLSDCLKIPEGMHTRASEMKVAQILIHLGWEHMRVRRNGFRVWVFRREFLMMES
jgi:hypothetical protein